jgi:hypothetical protein
LSICAASAGRVLRHVSACFFALDVGSTYHCTPLSGLPAEVAGVGVGEGVGVAEGVGTGVGVGVGVGTGVGAGVGLGEARLQRPCRVAVDDADMVGVGDGAGVTVAAGRGRTRQA